MPAVVSLCLRVTDDPYPLVAAEYRERSERARAQARTRYGVYLAEALDQRGSAGVRRAESVCQGVIRTQAAQPGR